MAAPTTFQRFRSLPGELRAQIWDEFMLLEGNGSRLVEANIYDQGLSSSPQGALLAFNPETDILSQNFVKFPRHIADPTRPSYGDLLHPASIHHIHLNIHWIDIYWEMKKKLGLGSFYSYESQHFSRQLYRHLDQPGQESSKGDARTVTISQTLVGIGHDETYRPWQRRLTPGVAGPPEEIQVYYRPFVYRFVCTSSLALRDAHVIDWADGLETPLKLFVTDAVEAGGKKDGVVLVRDQLPRSNSSYCESSTSRVIPSWFAARDDGAPSLGPQTDMLERELVWVDIFSDGPEGVWEMMDTYGNGNFAGFQSLGIL
ncbi:hypothetical protein B0T21DRAFT_348657 [Apiosordaria backusii]|uniref:Uncharacterized protein n=1 Tax=Apiosordaria backusii TaxID=314023 RepID=A0AA40BLU1_9PEZI|nr:hypothetical protein B0T21DRAFT_348657 [Apiosordaria backusii]